MLNRWRLYHPDLQVVSAHETTLYLFHNAVSKQLATEQKPCWRVIQCLAWQVIILVLWLLAQPPRDHIRMKLEQASRKHIAVMPFWFPDSTVAVVGSLGRGHLCLADTSNNVSNVCWRTVSQYQSRLLTTKGGVPSGLLQGPICFQWSCNVGLRAVFTFFGWIVIGVLNQRSQAPQTQTLNTQDVCDVYTAFSRNSKLGLVMIRKKMYNYFTKHHKCIHWKCSLRSKPDRTQHVLLLRRRRLNKPVVWVCRDVWPVLK